MKIDEGNDMNINVHFDMQDEGDKGLVRIYAQAQGMYVVLNRVSTYLSMLKKHGDLDGECLMLLNDITKSFERELDAYKVKL